MNNDNTSKYPKFFVDFEIAIGTNGGYLCSIQVESEVTLAVLRQKIAEKLGIDQTVLMSPEVNILLIGTELPNNETTLIDFFEKQNNHKVALFIRELNNTNTSNSTALKSFRADRLTITSFVNPQLISAIKSASKESVNNSSLSTASNKEKINFIKAARILRAKTGWNWIAEQNNDTKKYALYLKFSANSPHSLKPEDNLSHSFTSDAIATINSTLALIDKNFNVAFFDTTSSELIDRLYFGSSFEFTGIINSEDKINQILEKNIDPNKDNHLPGILIFKTSTNKEVFSGTKTLEATQPSLRTVGALMKEAAEEHSDFSYLLDNLHAYEMIINDLPFLSDISIEKVHEKVNLNSNTPITFRNNKLGLAKTHLEKLTGLTWIIENNCLKYLTSNDSKNILEELKCNLQSNLPHLFNKLKISSQTFTDSRNVDGYKMSIILSDMYVIDHIASEGINFLNRAIQLSQFNDPNKDGIKITTRNTGKNVLACLGATAARLVGHGMISREMAESFSDIINMEFSEKGLVFNIPKKFSHYVYLLHAAFCNAKFQSITHPLIITNGIYGAKIIITDLREVVRYIEEISTHSHQYTIDLFKKYNVNLPESKPITTTSYTSTTTTTTSELCNQVGYPFPKCSTANECLKILIEIGIYYNNDLEHAKGAALKFIDNHLSTNALTAPEAKLLHTMVSENIKDDCSLQYLRAETHYSPSYWLFGKVNYNSDTTKGRCGKILESLKNYSPIEEKNESNSSYNCRS